MFSMPLHLRSPLLRSPSFTLQISNIRLAVTLSRQLEYSIGKAIYCSASSVCLRPIPQHATVSTQTVPYAAADALC